MEAIGGYGLEVQQTRRSVTSFSSSFKICGWLGPVSKDREGCGVITRSNLESRTRSLEVLDSVHDYF